MPGKDEFIYEKEAYSYFIFPVAYHSRVQWLYVLRQQP